MSPRKKISIFEINFDFYYLNKNDFRITNRNYNYSLQFARISYALIILYSTPSILISEPAKSLNLTPSPGVNWIIIIMKKIDDDTQK